MGITWHPKHYTAPAMCAQGSGESPCQGEGGLGAEFSETLATCFVNFMPSASHDDTLNHSFPGTALRVAIGIERNHDQVFFSLLSVHVVFIFVFGMCKDTLHVHCICTAWNTAVVRRMQCTI